MGNGLYYYYGSMSSGKSTSLLQTAFNYKEKGYEVLIYTSALDDRYGVGKVTSRIGIDADAIIIPKDNITVLNDAKISMISNQIKAIFVDECQFLSAEQVDILGSIVDEYDISVFCYGIRTDFESNLFSGSKRLFEISDKIEELRNICQCGKKAIMNARLVDSTEQVLIGGNDVYQSMCRKCYRNYLNKKA
ncbi:Thymidine kinase [Yersinia phage fHe-Yen9-04]|uniref:Thymidine kinase n=1 Tax=Yersinia phage fHe-Yen9-04 TaxID=2052742 RepID=A0A2C9CX99_9CAUD|nr:thymidine kinase [Yersinia phage fHe-Yen9-04]SOK58443.1 Thymidine kinase [Yersinia phage fHe-Yen9-04]VUE36212.1 Thymidine kinase [Yersinia phage fHe-Yen9-04]